MLEEACDELLYCLNLEAENSEVEVHYKRTQNSDFFFLILSDLATCYYGCTSFDHKTNHHDDI